MVSEIPSVITHGRRKPVLLVFIHGFLGSEASFCDFPVHVVETLVDRHKLLPTDIETYVFPRYDTRGNNARAAQKLIDWLLVFATTAKYRCVILLAHSMGGLLAADAYQYLYSLHNGGSENKGSGQGNGAAPGSGSAASWLANVGAPLGRWLSRGRNAASAAGPSDSANAPANSAQSSSAGAADTQPNSSDRPPDTQTSAPSSSKTSEAPSEAPTIPDASIPSNRTVTPGDPTQTAHLNDHEWERVEKKHDETDSELRLLVNIRGLLTFDSPFYGLHTNVITQAGASKAVAVVSEGLSNVTSYLPGVAALLPESIPIPTGKLGMKVEVPTELLLRGVRNVGVPATTAPVTAVEQDKEADGAGDSPGAHRTMKDLTASLDNADVAGGPSSNSPPDGPPLQNTTPPVPTTTAVVPVVPAAPPASSYYDYNNWPMWARYATTGAAIAAGAYTVLGVTPVAAALLPVTAVARSMAMSHVEHLREHLEFLYPLINSQQEMDRRVQTLQREMETRGRLMFKGFYLALPPYNVATAKKASTSPNQSDPTYVYTQPRQDHATAPIPDTSNGQLQDSNTSTSDQSNHPPQSSPINDDLDAFLPDDATLLLDDVGPPPRHFCNPPPSSTRHLFSTISSPFMNEIDAHMNMFSGDLGGQAYVDIVYRTADAVAEIIGKDMSLEIV
ncbi:hypothetical protein HK097_005936 [Rhizophlyctis rosea]|uniref:GPI inositol-deacylase n=1 Tax=Rhizophlyctis rosea TaxID=64517 RepID=A0AAD5X303_9FUNG|nr:hypothetical protein HK097_005936 [Rhizophlyctis rosea]